MTRPALHEETGISQPTLGRILEPFRDRNWVERRGQKYTLTAWGHLLAEDFGDLLDTVESIQRLCDVVQQLPTDEQDIPVALVEAESATIRSWVETQIDEYREQSTALTVEDLPS